MLFEQSLKFDCVIPFKNIYLLVVERRENHKITLVHVILGPNSGPHGYKSSELVTVSALRPHNYVTLK